MRSRYLLSLVAIVSCVMATAANASMVWNETIDGDLSNDGLAPTPLMVSAGSNSILGTTGDAGQGVDRDYFRITVPTGMELFSIRLLPNTFVSGSASFIGMQDGPQLTVSPTGAGAENLLGFTHYSNEQIGMDILPAIHIVPAIVGYPVALPAGTYSVWVQETGGPVAYGFDFAITPVPLPGAAVLLLSGLMGLSTLRLRGRNARSPEFL